MGHDSTDLVTCNAALSQYISRVWDIPEKSQDPIPRWDFPSRFFTAPNRGSPDSHAQFTFESLLHPFAKMNYVALKYPTSHHAIRL